MNNGRLAIDIGAESGRHVLGTIAEGQLKIEEIYRFPNRPIQQNESLRWDVPQLVKDVYHGINLADNRVASVGIDTWAVDFGLLDEQGTLLELPYHYRDSHTQGVMEEVCAALNPSAIYAQTGTQFLPFNTLYQLRALVKAENPHLKRASSIAMIPDLLMAALTGDPRPRIELTNASSTQCLNPVTGCWNNDILTRLGIPLHLFPETVEPGTLLGQVQSKPVQVIAPATHDTGSAVAAIPIEAPDSAWISSGTWSILGVETPTPVISSVTESLGLTNELGYKRNRLSKNVMGLWILQQARRAWEESGTQLTYAEFVALAAETPSPNAFFDPDAPEFLAPKDMLVAIREKLRQTGQPQPETAGAIVRAILESLALKYRFVIEKIETVTGKPIRAIHIVGGGSQNRLLNQLTADACGVPVIAGPAESSALGNIIVQMIAAGEIENLAEARALVRRSNPLETFQPHESRPLADHYPAFCTLLNSGQP